MFGLPAAEVRRRARFAHGAITVDEAVEIWTSELSADGRHPVPKLDLKRASPVRGSADGRLASTQRRHSKPFARSRAF